MRRAAGWWAVALLTAGTLGCAAKNRPPLVKGEQVQPGGEPVEAIRRQLQGTWELVALESVPPRGGARVPIGATGTLVYDEFGNLTIDARSADPNAPAAAREVGILAFKGRAVIDNVKRELQLMALSGNVDPGEVLSPERRRRFQFGPNTLTLSSIDAQGDVSAISTWRRRN